MKLSLISGASARSELSVSIVIASSSTSRLSMFLWLEISD